ncbi:hypothetical protein [[Mycoplasma] collis]|uniref:hypothetical protein n=1 Tax=[Mycoplasma] collis TaxID=2127 RepID=UPI00051BE336|nr:hypothetical protein [[Mycoplasma] collis]
MFIIIFKSFKTYIILLYIFFFSILSFISITFQLEASKILFNFSEDKTFYFIFYQIGSLFLEILARISRSLNNFWIKKQAISFLLKYKKESFNLEWWAKVNGQP